jgi:hypothetical protein
VQRPRAELGRWLQHSSEPAGNDKLLRLVKRFKKHEPGQYNAAAALLKTGTMPSLLYGLKPPDSSVTPESGVNPDCSADPRSDDNSDSDVDPDSSVNPAMLYIMHASSPPLARFKHEPADLITRDHLLDRAARDRTPSAAPSGG